MHFDVLEDSLFRCEGLLHGYCLLVIDGAKVENFSRKKHNATIFHKKSPECTGLDQ
jgi:hypothetical protein